MIEAKRYFTATQLAAALDVSRVRAHQFMGGIRPAEGRVRAV